MLSDEQVEKIVERLLQRVEQANTYFLKQLGSKVKQIKKLTPSEAHKLVQMLKYGGEYNDIVNKISKYTDINIKEIDKIFKEFTKKDQSFAKDFYEYRNKPYIPYEQNVVLKRQTEALARIVKKEMYNYTRKNVLGYAIRDAKSNIVKFMPLRETYNKVLDEAFVQISQGKETFDSAMSRMLADIGGSGLRTIEYESGRHIRLDSAIRMHTQSRLRELHNENQELFGKEFDADGVEISVHANPAPDHAPVQGRQFSTVKPSKNKLSEWEKLQSGVDAVAYNGITYNLDHDAKNGYRPISELNCYHYTFAIVLGVSEPEYSDKELQQIIDDNNKGFELDGKHYTMYEGTQLQRGLERKIREQKDIQILAKESDNKELIAKSQSNITTLTNKYKELSQASGLPTKANRLKVSGYKRVAIKQAPVENINDKLSKYNINIDKSLYEEGVDKGLVDRSLNQVNNLVNKYPILKNKFKEDGLSIEANYMPYAGETTMTGDKIMLSKGLYKNREKYMSLMKEGQDDNWSAKINKENYDIYNITHEMGHTLEDTIIKEKLKGKGVNLNKLFDESKYATYMRMTQEDDNIFNEIFVPVSEKTGISWESLRKQYISDYGKSETFFEWFAELFAKMELGEEDIMTKALKEYLEGELWKK